MLLDQQVPALCANCRHDAGRHAPELVAPPVRRVLIRSRVGGSTGSGLLFALERPTTPVLPGAAPADLGAALPRLVMPVVSKLASLTLDLLGRHGKLGQRPFQPVGRQ